MRHKHGETQLGVVLWSLKHLLEKGEKIESILAAGLRINVDWSILEKRVGWLDTVK